MAELPVSSVWDDFIDAVEGRGGPDIDGAQPRKPGKRPDILIEFLESDVPMPAEVCAWLIGLFTSEGDGPIRLAVEGLGKRRVADEILGQLRAGEPTTELRRRMAQMLRARGRALRLECIYRRRGAPGEDGMRHWEVAKFYERLRWGHDYMVKFNDSDKRPSAWVMDLVTHEIVEGRKTYRFYEGNIGHKHALTIASRRYGIERRLVEEAVSFLRKARRDHSTIADDDRGSYPASPEHDRKKVGN